MNLSYSRYSAFLQNPERFRLKYALSLEPESDLPGRFCYGRRRGSCFHAFMEGVPIETIKAQFPADMITRCERLIPLVPDLGEVLVREADFEAPIGDERHGIRGRLDHIARKDFLGVGDFKTTKARTKKEFRQYLAELETSPQAHFYLYAAKILGYETDRFTYHILIDDKDKPEYYPLELPPIGPAEVERKMRSVYSCCVCIEFLTERYGADKPWPHSNHWPCQGDKLFCQYQDICGRLLPAGCVPTGYVSSKKEPELTEESE